jgi:hypothetical protein
MTVTTTANSIRYAGNGATLAFAFPYIFFKPTDLVVTLYDSATFVAQSPPPVLNGGATYDYTVTGVLTDGEYASGGTVTFHTPPAGGLTVVLLRAVPAIQTVTLIDNTKFPANTVNTEFDYLTVLAQQSLTVAGTSLTIPSEEAGLNTQAAPHSVRQGKVLAWDNAGNLIHSTKFLVDIEAGIGGGGSPATVYIGSTPPVVSAPGQFWFFSDDVSGGGQLYLSYQDADSTQWVPASPVNGTSGNDPLPVYSGAGPPSFAAVKGALYSNTTATTATTRVYVNTGGTTWTNLVAGA